MKDQPIDAFALCIIGAMLALIVIRLGDVAEQLEAIREALAFAVGAP